MKLYSTLTLSLLSAAIFAQQRKDYIIKRNKDTLFTKVLKLDRTMQVVTCEEGGKKVKYKAKDILAVKADTLFYESGLVRLKRLRGKQFIFLRRTIKGNLCLYETNDKRTKFLVRTFGDDLLHLRWVYRAHDWSKSETVIVYFYKKEWESRESFSIYWKEKVGDCKLLQDKISSGTAPWTPAPKELVRFYNENCK